LRVVVRLLIAGSVIGLASPLMAAVPATERNAFETLDSCQNHLNSLILILEETAQLEGARLAVSWRKDGTVELHYDGYSLYFWCQGGDLQIDCLENPPAETEDCIAGRAFGVAYTLCKLCSLITPERSRARSLLEERVPQ